jgi:hypothetical protein
MQNRCCLPSHPAYPQYGGRGVKICERWNIFTNFAADVGERPLPGYFLDRIDPYGNYELDNIRWLSPGESTKNKRTFGAIERFTTEELLAELARRGVEA